MTNETQCISAEAAVIDKFYNIVRVLQIIFGIIILTLILRIVWFYNTKPMKLHNNLILVLFTYLTPCDCLIQVWLVYLIRIPFFIYIVGSPLFHFAIMIERVLATINVKIYENQGKIIGFISTIIVVIYYFIN
uniref:G_PROTEIN_RECEP_F1_2 domain-containing protein n=1 Tax=Meloidogyne hapla TaxID=6305 RepID=A0A1I8BQ33_MELHA